MSAMRLGRTGIDVRLLRQGMETGLCLDYDRVELALNESGLRSLQRQLEWLLGCSPCRADASEPLAGRNGHPCSLNIVFDPGAKEEDR